MAFRSQPAPDEAERQLIEQAQRHDPEAFGVLYTRHFRAIYRYIYFRVGHEQDAEDVAEEVFVRAWKAMPRYRITRHPFVSWLYRIAHNLVVDYHQSKPPTLPTEISGDEGSGPRAQAEERLADQQQQEALAAAIRQLPEIEQQVIVLRFVEGVSHQQVARIIGKSEAACRVIQHRALDRLGKLLED